MNKHQHAAYTRILLMCITLLFCSAIRAQEQNPQYGALAQSSVDKVIVYVDTYPPYINDEREALGSSASTLKVLAEYANIDIEYRYVPYSDAPKLMKLGKKAVSFPYFYTQERAEQFHLSDPIVTIPIRVFFNRQYADLSDRQDIQGLRVGAVAGYSYGEKIDDLLNDPIEFETDMSALIALMSNEIDVLPMANGVMNSLLGQYFSEQRELIRAVTNITGSGEFHLMAPKTPYGLAVKQKIDRAIEQKFGNALPKENRTERVPDTDVAELIPAEGFPAIIGDDVANANINYTLPIGTKVLVLDWSQAIREPNTPSTVNRNMMLTSKVVVLNGPHVGKELMIRNMHIQLN